jgi:hypothetical protein
VLAVAGLLLVAALVARRGSGQRSAPSARSIGIVYLFDQETREARTALLPGDTRRRDIRRRPLGLVVEPNGEPSGAGIAQIWATADGLMIQDGTAPAATPLLHDQTYALAGGAVVVRYRSPDGRRETRDQRREMRDER